MKKIKILIVGMLIAVCTFCVTACDFDFGSLIKDIITNNVFPYSEDGFREIGINFPIENGDVIENIESDIDLTSIVPDIDSVAYSWDITVSTEGVNNNFSLKYYRDTSGEVYYDKFVYQTDSARQVILRIGEQRYYIDEDSKAVFSTTTDLFAAMESACVYAGRYGIIDLQDEEGQPNWLFVAKDEEASVVNSEDETVDAIHFQYNSIEAPLSDTDVTMDVFFAKMLIPYIIRIDYTITVPNAPSTAVKVFRLFDTQDITEELFAIPTVEDGYTFD